LYQCRARIAGRWLIYLTPSLDTLEFGATTTALSSFWNLYEFFTLAALWGWIFGAELTFNFASSTCDVAIRNEDHFTISDLIVAGYSSFNRIRRARIRRTTFFAVGNFNWAFVRNWWALSLIANAFIFGASVFFRDNHGFVLRWTSGLRRHGWATLAFHSDRAVGLWNVSSNDACFADLLLCGIRFAGIFIGDANRGICVALLRRSFVPVINAKATRVVCRLAGCNEMSIFDAAMFAFLFQDALSIFVANHIRRTSLEASLYALVIMLIASIAFVLVEPIQAADRRFERNARIVARAFRCCVFSLTRTLDWTKLLASPSDGRSLAGASFRIDADGGAEAVAVAAEVAGASVVDAPVVEGRRIDRTGGEEGTLHHTAFLLGKRFLFVGVALGRRFFCCLFALRIRPPDVGELVGLGDGDAAVPRREIVGVVVVEVPAKAAHFAPVDGV